MTGDAPDAVAVTFTVPAGWVGFLGSPGEFARAERFTAGSSFASARTLSVGDGRRELRLFTLPPGVVMKSDLARVPGFNIQILPAGIDVVVRVTRSALIALDGEGDSGGRPSVD